MKRFSFRLEGMLSFKQWQEDDAKRALGFAVQALQEKKQYKQKLQTEHETLVVLRRESPLLGPMEHMHFIRYGNKLVVDITKQQQAIEEQEKVVLAKTKELNKAMIERKKMEKLRERSLQRYVKDKKRKDTGILDEVSTNFYGREKALS
ncbi:MAG: flagellar export protein FliJ [Fibrobacteria bacterium]|nr:flagellar export protein FliJ [Fibrobacteria bacterium]